MIQILKDLLENIHPAMIHFSIGASVLALAALLCGAAVRQDWLKKTAAWLWIMSFVFAVPAVVSGYLFASHLGLMDHFELIPPAGSMKGVLRDHVLWSLAASALSLTVLTGALRMFKGKPWPMLVQVFLGTALAVLFCLAGHEGGEMVFAGAPAPAPIAKPTDLFEKAKDYQTNLVLMNSKRWLSKAHGYRWVNVYVSKEAVESFKNGDTLPEGTIIVKDSFQNEGGKVSSVPGPLWMKVKGPLSDSPETGGWLFGLRWEHPVPGNPEKISMPVTWLPGDSNLSYCLRCHNHFKSSDYSAGIPEGYEK